MVQFDGRLFNVPQPGLFEAGSSWMSRLALAQGASLSEVLKLFRFIGHVDLDRRLRGNRLAQIRRVCGLPNSALAIHERVMTSLESMHPVGEHYLAQTESNRPRFRFCPQCLSEMRSPHFPIHWRFIAWRWCSVHDCLLEDTCPNCARPTSFPTDIATSKAGRLGYAMLNRCLSCGQRLDRITPCYLQIDGFRRVSRLEQMILENGRALLAALYHGWFSIEGRRGHFQLSKLKEIERNGGLPMRLDWLPSEKVRLRKPVGERFGLSDWNAFMNDD